MVFTEFLMRKFLKFLHLPCFRSRHYEFISMQLYSLRALQKYKECTLISIDFVEFSMKNYSNFSNSYTIGLNITKPPPYYWKFSNCTKHKKNLVANFQYFAILKKKLEKSVSSPKSCQFYEIRKLRRNHNNF